MWQIFNWYIVVILVQNLWQSMKLILYIDKHDSISFVQKLVLTEIIKINVTIVNLVQNMWQIFNKFIVVILVQNLWQSMKLILYID